MAQGSPQVLVQYLMEKTSQLRSEGQLEQTASVMDNGLRGLPEEVIQPLQLELADMYLELEQTSQAQQIYLEVLEVPQTNGLFDLALQEHISNKKLGTST